MKNFLNNLSLYQITIFSLILIFFFIQFTLTKSNLDKSRLYIIVGYSPPDEKDTLTLNELNDKEKKISQLNTLDFQNNLENKLIKNFSQKYKYNSNPLKKYSYKINYSFHLVYFFEDEINSNGLLKIKNEINTYFKINNINHLKFELKLIND